MTEKTYDTRDREQILVAEWFAPYRNAPALAALGLRELRTLDHFFRFAVERGVTVPGG